MRNNKLTARKVILESEIAGLMSFISNSPEGALVSRATESGSYRYSLKKTDESGKYREIYLPKNMRTQAEALALKAYARERLKDALVEKKAVDAQLKLYEEKNTDRLLKSRPGLAQLVIPHLKKSNDDFAEEWQNRPYDKSTKYKDHLKIPTIVPDLLVRSKSEAEMVSALIDKKVPFHYEELAIVNGVALHPDFTCLNKRTREVFYIEHQGKWDDPEYVEDVRRREDLYLQAGIYPWKQLLITTETLEKPFDIRWFYTIIDYYLL